MANEISPIPATYLPFFLNRFFPFDKARKQSLQQIVTPPTLGRPPVKGMWLTYLSPHPTDDECGWYVIHWPTFVRYAFTDRHFLNDKGFLSPAYQALDIDHPHVFDEQWRSFKRYFDKHYLPPGANLWSENDRFQMLCQAAPEAENYPGAFTVFRLGEMYSDRYKNLEALREALTPLEHLTTIYTDKAFFARLEKPLQLVIQALVAAQDSSTCENAASEWGIAWVHRGLLFNYGRALDRIQGDPNPLVNVNFQGDKYDNFITVWAQDYPYNLRPRLPGLPKLKEYLVRDDRPYMEMALTPYEAVREYNKPGESRLVLHYHWLFPLNKRKHTLFSVLEHLAKLQSNPTLLQELERKETNRRRVRATKVDKGRGKPKNSARKSRLTFDARQFATAGKITEFEDLTVRALRYDGEIYLAFPDNLTRFYPELKESRWFDRKHVRPDTKRIWVNPQSGKKNILEVPRTHLDNIRVCCNDTHQDDTTVYLHPALLTPDGEGMTFLKELDKAKNPPELGVAPGQIYIEVFENFLMFVHCPDQLIAEGRPFGAEVESLVDESYNCPIKLESYSERLEFFFQKGDNMKHRTYGYLDNPGINGPRSLRLTTYDKWCLWYAATQELPHLRYQLNKVQQQEYMAKRWTRWRRPASLKGYLTPPPYHLQPVRRPTLPRDMTVDDLLEEAQEQFGDSFTGY